MPKPRCDQHDIMINQRLRALRLDKNMTQEKIGKIIGVSIQQVQKYEQAVNRVPASKLYLLAKALNIHIGEFFDFTDQDYRLSEIPKRDRRGKMLEGFEKLNASQQQALQGLIKTMLEAQKKNKEEEENGSGRTE